MAEVNDPIAIKYLSLCGPKLFFTTVFHPIEYTKVLIQIGHEPLPPVAARSLFNKPTVYLPNVFKYAQHIKSVDGFNGCFRGLTPRLCSSLITTIITNEVEGYFDGKSGENKEENKEEPSEEKVLVDSLKKKLTISTVTIVASQPLHVVAVRMMAQFVGGETKYDGILSSLYTIYKEEGIAGFFTGFVPRLLGDLLFILFYETCLYSAKKFLQAEELVPDQIVSLVLDFSIKNLLYPFQLSSVCVTVNNCGLVAGLPPSMPHYRNWYDCYQQLKESSQLKRGNGMFFRSLPKLTEKKQ